MLVKSPGSLELMELQWFLKCLILMKSVLISVSLYLLEQLFALTEKRTQFLLLDLHIH